MPVSESFILSDPDLKDPIPLEYLSHADRYSAEVKKSCLLMAKLRQASARYNIYLSSRKKKLYLLYYTITICNSYCHGQTRFILDKEAIRFGWDRAGQFSWKRRTAIGSSCSHVCAHFDGSSECRTAEKMAPKSCQSQHNRNIRPSNI